MDCDKQSIPNTLFPNNSIKLLGIWSSLFLYIINTVAKNFKLQDIED